MVADISSNYNEGLKLALGGPRAKAECLVFEIPRRLLNCGISRQVVTKMTENCASANEYVQIEISLMCY